MKDISGTLNYKGKDYKLVFDLVVLQAIQDEYGTFSKWCDLIEGKDNADGEPHVKALIFAYTEMINEGIDIENDEEPAEPVQQPLTTKQVSRMVTAFGMDRAIDTLNAVMGDSTQPGEESKNASSPTKTNKKKQSR